MRHTPDFELIVTEKILQVSYATAYAAYATAFATAHAAYAERREDLAVFIRYRIRLIRHRILTKKLPQASCDSFDRRYLIYHRMFDYLTSSRGSSDHFSDDANVILRLHPLRDSLERIKVQAQLTCC